MEIQEVLLKIHEDMATIKADITAVKIDLKEHMRRTAILEGELKQVTKRVNIAHGAIIAIPALLTFLWKMGLLTPLQ